MYHLNDGFNADEHFILYRQAPNITIRTIYLEGKKEEKDRIAILACTYGYVHSFK